MFLTQLAQTTGVTVTQPRSDNGLSSMRAGYVVLPPIRGVDSDSETESTFNTAQHTYRPLKANEIRLLVLNPGSREDPIECFLEHYNVDHAKPYQALSYVWGSTHDPKAIHVDGSPFTVTKNLGGFLLSFRTEHECFVLWIDAVCINQNDIEERNAQIQLMKRVYECADSVVIWLGSEILSTGPAVKHAEHLYRSLWLPRLEGEGSPERALSSLTAVDLSLLFGDNSDITKEVWEGIQDLLQRPWWSRIWVYQEATAPAKNGSTVFCGTHSLRLEKLLTINKIMLTFNAIARPNLPLVDGLSQQYIRTSLTSVFIDVYTDLRCQYLKKGTSDFLKMTDLLPTLRRFEATNPRDKLYALIPTSLDGADLLDVDYRLPVEDVYITAALSFLQKHRNLDILGHCTEPEEASSLELPSWVPNWTARDAPVHFFKRRQFHDVNREDEVSIGKLYNASNKPAADIRVDERARKLFCKGFTFDSVERVSATAGAAYDSGTVAREWSRWLEDSSLSHTLRTSVLARTLVADSYRVGVDIATRGCQVELSPTHEEMQHPRGRRGYHGTAPSNSGAAFGCDAQGTFGIGVKACSNW
jgi:Heterokaryon incompatibility protein (HET)